MAVDLINRTKLVRVSNAVAVGTSAVNSSSVDTSGYDGCRFIVHFGTITDGPPSIKVQQDTVTGMGGANGAAWHEIVVLNVPMYSGDIWPSPGERSSCSAAWVFSSSN